MEMKKTEFIIAGRLDPATNEFMELTEERRNAMVVPEFRHMFKGIPESVHRLDLSSTELREKGLTL